MFVIRVKNKVNRILGEDQQNGCATDPLDCDNLLKHNLPVSPSACRGRKVAVTDTKSNFHTISKNHTNSFTFMGVLTSNRIVEVKM